MHFFVGTSGYAYKEWKGSFYPPKMPPAQMLGFYAERFGTVEINNTFYRMPETSVVESWKTQVPASFRFVLKAPQAITHRKRLKGAEDDTEMFLEAAAVLGKQRGPLLFQLPPNMKKDLERLGNFLDLVGKRAQIAFEFRHESWFEDDVLTLLRKHACTLCVADTDELPAPEIVATADWGYLRLRRAEYTREDLETWLKRVRKQKWKEAYVFFKHEDTGTAPQFATTFLECLSAT